MELIIIGLLASTVVVALISTLGFGRRVQPTAQDDRLSELILRAHHIRHYGAPSGCGHVFTCDQCSHDRRRFVKRWRLLGDALDAYSKTGEYQQAMNRYIASDEYRERHTLRLGEDGQPLCRECDGPMITYDDLKPEDVIVSVDIAGQDQDVTGLEYRFCRPCKSRQIVRLGTEVQR